MKISNVVFILFFLFDGISLNAQQPFLKTYGSDNPECAHEVRVAPDGRITIASRSAAANDGNAEGVFIKLSAEGAIEQSRRLSADREFFLSGVFPDFQGEGAALIGTTRTSRGDFDGVILRLRGNGKTRWQKSIGTTRDDFFKSFTVTAEGAYAVLGDTVTTSGSRDFFVAQYNKRGGIRWKKTFGTSGDDAAFHISHTSDGGFILSGASHESDQSTPSRAVVVKLDGAGNIQWSKRYAPVARFNNGEFVIQAFDLGFYLVQFTANNHDLKGKTLVTKLDANGIPLFSRLFRSGSASLHATQAFIASDGGLILSGFVHNGSGSRGVLLKLDAAGNVLWKKAIKASNQSVALNGVLEIGDSSFLSAGCFGIEADDEPKDAVLVKVNSSGTTGGSCSSLTNVRITSGSFNLQSETIELPLSEPSYQTGNPRLHNTIAVLESDNICP